MRIEGTIPMHIARAYAMPSMAKPAPVTHSAAQVNHTSKLVAAQISQRIDFARDTMPSAPAQPGVLQMYTRAADRIEAAINVELGRQIDVRA